MYIAKEIGEIFTKSSHEFEWTIQDFFSYTEEDASYISPLFDVSGSRWYLKIHPNGQTKNNTVGWIALFLNREVDLSPPQGACYTFGLKRADGTVEQMKEDITWVFDGEEGGFGHSELLLRSKLLELKSELAPSDALTLTCSLWVDKDIGCSASKDMLSRDFLDMLTSKKGCDVTLKLKQEEYPVHQFVLAARSPVFAAIFDDDMNEMDTGVVDIMDCDPETFKDFIAYLYSGEAENLSSNALELYKIACNYGVRSLKSACLISIMLNLSVENVCAAIELAHEFSINALKNKTQAFFNKNFKKMFATARWETFLLKNCLLVNELLKKLGAQM